MIDRLGWNVARRVTGLLGNWRGEQEVVKVCPLFPLINQYLIK